MPGPMVPRPAPMPSAMDFSPSSLAWAMGPMRERTLTVRQCSLVTFGDRLAEVDAGKGGEDEGLQGRDQQDLEEEEDHGHDPGDHAQRGDAEEDDQPAAHEQDEQVAGQDVGEEPDGQGDDPDELR